MEHGNGEAMPLIIMLTDGQPTSGSVTSTSEIIKRITNLIDGRLSLFSVGFGNGVDFSFLEKLSLSNQALARKVYEDSSASLQMKGFYDEVANPLLFNINIEYSHGLVDEDSLTQSNFMAYFDGTEITVAGKLKDEVIYAVWNSSNDASGPMAGEHRDESDLVRNETILASAQRPDTISLVDGNEGGSYGELSVVITGQSLDVDIVFNTSTPIEVSSGKQVSMRTLVCVKRGGGASHKILIWRRKRKSFENLSTLRSFFWVAVIPNLLTTSIRLQFIFSVGNL